MINQPYSPFNALLPKQGEENIFVAMVQNENVVQMYPMRSGDTGIFFNFDQNKFWIKSIKGNGVPEPIQRYSFTRENVEENNSNYVTREDFKKFEEKILSILNKGEVKKNDESNSVQ